jgi:hypothetical protein
VQDFRLYPQALARLDLDLAIAPLEIHAFNECKSNLRLLEYGAMGWPVICTDIYPYQNAPVTRLPNDPQKWISTIREQLAEPDALREAGLEPAALGRRRLHPRKPRSQLVRRLRTMKAVALKPESMSKTGQEPCQIHDFWLKLCFFGPLSEAKR